MCCFKIEECPGLLFLTSASKNWVCFCLHMEKGGSGEVLNLSKMQRHEHGEEFVITSITGSAVHMILAG